MVTNNFFKSDLYRIHDIVQNSMTLQPKELVIATMRDFFSNDSYYHYVHDLWGFPLTPDYTNLPEDSGFHDNTTTRLFIGESYRFDIIYYPALIVRHGGSTSVPISINREVNSVKWEDMVFEDGYGNIKTFMVPSYFIFAGAWEGSINIEIMAKDLRARDDLVDLVSLLFVDIAFNDLYKSGLIVKGVSAGAPTETDDRNDKIFRQTVTLQIRSEWRRHVPVKSVIEVINTSVEFQRTTPILQPADPNMTIHTTQTLAQVLANL